MKHRILFAMLALAAGILPAAQAHVTLEQQTAVAGSTYKAVFRVGHGCEGSPTTRITVFLPAGFVGAKPMPKPGWTLSVQNEQLLQPYDSHGKQITERAAIISWSGGRLLDAEYDEFILRGSVPTEAEKHYIRVLQECEKGQNDWAAIPTGQDKPAFPAAVLTIVPAAAKHAHQH